MNYANSAVAVSHSASTTNIVYLPGLNGLRAIAALAVVVAHITLSLKEFGLDNKILGTDKDGNATGLYLAVHGVTIFFTLSGFLITYLLLKEKEVARLKVKNFYIRRILRIWPLYYLYFFICMATIWLYDINFTPSAVPFYIFLAANIPYILGKALPLLGHYWSLGVEEQFYLFFPHLAKYANKKLLRISIALILVLLSAKFIFWGLHRLYDINLPLQAISITRFHTMLIGVAGAILYYNKNRIFFSITTHKAAQIAAWAVLTLIAFNKFHIASVIDGELVSVVTVFLIMGQITKRNNIVNLENKVFDFIGKISYGIYVLHPLLIYYCYKLLGKFGSNAISNYLLIYALIITATILIAYLSYELYEKRFLKLKAKYATVKSLNTKNSS
jgi:peptidoglycan/LPS O-acetylase OafA/YrhL